MLFAEVSEVRVPLVGRRLSSGEPTRGVAVRARVECPPLYAALGRDEEAPAIGMYPGRTTPCVGVEAVAEPAAARYIDERQAAGAVAMSQQEFGLVPSPGIPPLVVDGSYGPITAEQVQFFQESWGLTQDAVAGRETWSFFSASQPGPRPWPLVKVGATQSSNWRVLAAQHLLRFRGATIAVDGAFGPLSGEAARTFQMTLRATFISTTLGQLDWPALVETVQLGDTGDAVRADQTLLPGSLAVDGDFGPLTDAAVRQFQGMFLPPADGIVGPETWHALTQRIFD